MAVRVSLRKAIPLKLGRKIALETLDAMLAERSNVELLHNDLQETFNQDPSKFFQDFVMPLLPKEQAISMDTKEGAGIRIFFEPGKGQLSAGADGLDAANLDTTHTGKGGQHGK